VGLIKMDTEGGETKILPQLKPFLTQFKPNILLSLVRARA
jgi:F0F1-type ATP synthase epsilon subunit